MALRVVGLIVVGIGALRRNAGLDNSPRELPLYKPCLRQCHKGLVQALSETVLQQRCVATQGADCTPLTFLNFCLHGSS